MTACSCPLAGSGFCERHGVHKSPHLVHLCKTDERYYAAWEEGRGIGQNAKPVDRREPIRRSLAKPTCLHRGDVLGKADCGCSGSPVVYHCSIHTYAMEHKLKPGKVTFTADGVKQSVDVEYCFGCEQFELTPPGDLVQHLITFDDWNRDTLTLSQMILADHPDVSGIAGCPRSGMRAACDVSLRLGLPLYEASFDGLRPVGGGGGSRIRSSKTHGPRRSFAGPIVIVDDSTCSGSAIREIKASPSLGDLPVYVVYAASPGRSMVTGYAVHKELPHWFDWNMLNNGIVLRSGVGVDFDGVLCSDCDNSDDDDGERYVAWMKSVRPIRFPRDYKVPFIVTARREAYRSITESWLAKWGINYGTLVMFPGTFADRSVTDIGQWKAEQCDRLGVGLFVESDYRQACRIAEIRGTPVVSIEPKPLG